MDSVDDATLKSIEIIALPVGRTREVDEKFKHPRSAFAMMTVGGSFAR